MNKLILTYKCKACMETFTVEYTTESNNLWDMLRQYIKHNEIEFHLCKGLQWGESLLGVGELIEGKLTCQKQL